MENEVKEEVIETPEEVAAEVAGPGVVVEEPETAEETVSEEVEAESAE